MSERTVVLLGGSWWKCWKQTAEKILSRSAYEFRWYGCRSSEFSWRGGALGTEQRGDSYGTADTLRHFEQSDGFPLMSQRLQSSTEKAATWRRNHFNFNHLSYSAANTHSKTHTHSHTNKYTWAWVQRLISVTTRVQKRAGHLAPAALCLLTHH